MNRDSSGYQKRSTEVLSPESEEALLKTVAQMDPQGCILRLLCSLQSDKGSKNQTNEAKLLVDLFTNITMHNPSVISTSFAHAADIGKRSQFRYSRQCAKVFKKCPLKDDKLVALLKESW